MKISEAIQRLSDILHEDGDMDLVCMTDVDDSFCIESDRVFEVIVPEGFDEPVCAYMEPEVLPNSPSLTVVK